ncbi:MAG: biopolymer transporter ExbD [Planctomycetota bacterium]
MKHRQHTTDATINLTPMIDVVFLLVIFFMVGSRMDSGDNGVAVTVPGAGDMRAMSRLPDRRLVDVSAGGSVALDGRSITLDELTSTLRRQHQDYPALRVAVRGDDNSSLQQIDLVMRRISSAGVQHIDLSARGQQR